MASEENKSNQTCETGATSSSALLRATSKIGGWTMISRVLGFVRDILLARVLGAGMLADAFFVAFKLPNFFRRMFAEGTLTVALVPVLAEARLAGEAEAHRFLDALATLLLIVLTLFTLIGMLLMPWLLYLFAPGFADEPQRWALALQLARWMFPYLAMISLAAMAWAVLNTYKRFAVPAASPALLNVAIIFAAVALAPSFDNPALALAIGVLLGGFLQLAIQFPALRRIGWIPRLNFDFKQPAIVETLTLFAPAVLAIAAVQINILVGTILATLLDTGAVSYLYYADRIVQLPLALFGIAMSTALLPTLSAHLSRGDQTAAADDLRAGLAWLSWITLPAVAGALYLAEPIVATLFERGAFTHADSIATAHTLQAYAVGLIAFCWARLLASACYAGKDAKAPMRYAAISVAVNIVLAVILMQFWAYVGLALATSLAAFVNVGLLYARLTNTYGSLLTPAIIRRLLSALAASAAMLLALAGFDMFWPFPATGAMQFAWLAAAMTGAIAIFLVSALILGERALLMRFLKRRNHAS
ncbi:MAG: murein biosynthesis integral membrane protein MurJ [Zetaproteobacteria bacterium CG12_big_fil_rev_8_21_14_0_65_54_13]|nr:MAG: murein biosynthesis integral membrane protein MurJ [Zetaproteobacteria bacterium CG23_combo_of_CG06-09_8_20_14_all_54_7]PIW50515.1 MAG: murein biosynthesis integral membrane protein MurJ [Zetaproteobacteria bacterium CG12_big_fil_rev_8_21_14_0_65_54_13]PIX54976.1 MAG: murein biosynthesis integral membrane protein MurJ [Zetaproteobacteria bacterium CG_4_10_14_3_um_filter_54_28]PJA27636.1 MAG: murein biosynthesis integral membrane protein MurJ [Zetaproteobacteria bacterium CG_4_9_14_3_um_f